MRMKGAVDSVDQVGAQISDVMCSYVEVTGTMGGMQNGLKDHLSRLDEIFATRGDFVQTLQFMQQMADSIIKQLLGLPDWEQAKVDLAAIADRTAFVEYYRSCIHLLALKQWRIPGNNLTYRPQTDGQSRNL
ncbi:hypothetical protein NFI96_001639 [Prochilodus magdalenae]|nr:hypothetical protein NFI96_001639 [Prochilodus magdalenae]